MKMTITQDQFHLMVEDITSQLVQTLVEEYSYDLTEAINAVYTSNVYAALSRPTTMLYNQSTGYVLSYLLRELRLYPKFEDPAPLKVAEEAI